MEIVQTIMASQANNDILIWVDFQHLFSRGQLVEFMTNITERHPFLKSPPNGTQAEAFVLSNHIVSVGEMTGCRDNIREWPLLMTLEMSMRAPQWLCEVGNWPEDGTSRLILRISHAYADGYSLIKIFTGQETATRIGKHRRSLPSLQNCKSLLETGMHLVQKSTDTAPEEPDTTSVQFIRCKSIKLHDIRIASRQIGVTITAMLYAIMLIAHTSFSHKSKMMCGTMLRTSNVSQVQGLPLLPLVFDMDVANMSNDEVIRNSHKNFAACNNTFYTRASAAAIAAFTKLWGPEASEELVSRSIRKNIDLIFNSIIGPTVPVITHVPNIEVGKLGFATGAGPVTYNFITFNDRISVTVTCRGDRIPDCREYREHVEKVTNDVLYNVQR